VCQVCVPSHPLLYPPFQHAHPPPLSPPKTLSKTKTKTSAPSLYTYEKSSSTKSRIKNQFSFRSVVAIIKTLKRGVLKRRVWGKETTKGWRMKSDKETIGCHLVNENYTFLIYSAIKCTILWACAALALVEKEGFYNWRNDSF
jgi:hypothetical protein